MKFTNTLKQNKMLKISILLSLTAIAGFTYSPSVFAEEFITQPEDGPFYYNRQDGVQTTKIEEITKSFTFSNDLTDNRIDLGDEYRNHPNQKGNDNLTRIRLPIFRQNVAFAPKTQNGENPNAIVMKYWDGGKEKYTIIASTYADESRKPCSMRSGYQKYIEDLSMEFAKSEQAQEILYEALGKNDLATVENILSKVLPTFAYVKISDEKILELEGLSKSNSIDDIRLLLNPTDDDTEAAKKFFQSGWSVPVCWEMVSRVGYLENEGNNKDQYAYKQINLQNKDIWRPMDRAIGIVNASEGEYKLPKYWLTGGAVEEGAKRADDVEGFFKPATEEYIDHSISATEPTSVAYGDRTVIPVKELTTGVGAIIDLSYINTCGDNPLVKQFTKWNTIETGLKNEDGSAAEIPFNRGLLIDQATLGQNTTFRIGIYGPLRDLEEHVNDYVQIEKAEQAEEQIKANEKTQLNLQLGYVPGVGIRPFGKNIYKSSRATTAFTIKDGGNKFELNPQKSTAEGIFASYEITPELKRSDFETRTESSKPIYAKDADGNYFTIDKDGKTTVIMSSDGSTIFKPVDANNLSQVEMDYLNSKSATQEKDKYGNPAYTHTTEGSSWRITGYTYEDTGEVAERGKTVSENASIMRNLLRANNKNLFRRADQLRPSNLPRITVGGQGPTLDANDLRGEARENLWADVWHGKFSPEAGYGRTAEQSYNGVQVGYDKLLDKKFYNGKVYTGVYGSMMDGDSTTQTGEGEQKAYGVGVYSTWVGDRGHFIDLGMNATKLKNEYWLTANTGEGEIGKIDASNSTWAYGIGAQYGMRNQLTNNWFWEPSISFYAGRIGGSDYYLPGMVEVTREMQSAGYQVNNMKINESSYNTAIGRLGLKTGYSVKDEANFYAGISYAHDFADGPRLEQIIGLRNSNNNMVGRGIIYDNKGRKIDSYDGNDSWWEWSLGANAKISDNGIFNIDYMKTTGSDIGDDWSINGGLSFTWDGWANTVRDKAGKTNFTAAHSPTVVLGQKPNYKNVSLPQLQAKEGSRLDASARQEVTTDTEVTGEFVEGTGDFYMGGVTVEAERPDWEKALSPGQVSVIYPSQFEGEQKNLPEMLDRIPGLYVQKLNGYGHYTVARMRGSSAAQVAVYVDGVAMNLTGDVAVNLNAIPADNIERIEVYRGYVPARFAGAPMGGVINILTKRPNEGHGHISQGYKDYGGYNATYEYSMPLGDGSLLATYSRDIWQGDFDWIYPKRIPVGVYPDYKDAEFERVSNDYQNNNALLKWQDDHWTVKAAWKKSQEGLAVATTAAGLTEHGYRDNILNIDHKEFQIGRRDTLGNLDLGWHVAYLDNDKHFDNTGLRRLIADSEKGTLPPNVAPFRESQAVPGQIWGTYHSKKWNGNLNASMKMGSSHLLEFNGDITLENMDCNGNAWNTKTETNWVTSNSNTGVDKFIRAMLPEYENKEYHLTLQDTITLNQAGDFKLTTIGRADKVEMDGIGPSGDDSDAWRYSGGLALQKQLDDNLSIKSTWGTYNRHPNFYEIFGDGGFIRSNYIKKDNNGNPVNPEMWENGTQFDFSLNWQGKLAEADTDTVLTYYNRKSENQLVLWTPRGGDGISCYAPTGELEAYGVELSHNMKWDRLNLGLAATWQKSKTLDGGLGWQYNWQDGHASFVPEWVVSARIDYLFPGDKLNIFGEYRYTDNEVLWGNTSDEGIQVLDDYSIIDMGLKYTFDKSWRLSAGVNDLLDKGRKVFIDNTNGPGFPLLPNNYPLPGRMYYTTLEYSF